MTTFLYYVDESFDDNVFCLSMLGFEAQHWRANFTAVKAHRSRLKTNYGLPIRKEIHTRKFVKGKGTHGLGLSKATCCHIYEGLLALAASLQGVELFNACMKVQGSTSDPQMKAWDRLLNRIERTMLHREQQTKTPTTAIIIADEGKDAAVRKLRRKMGVHNPIPSNQGAWPSGQSTANIPLQHIVEDPFFGPSHRSYFLQMADACAYALLKKESQPPTSHVATYGLDKVFVKHLVPICATQATKNDPHGIVRA